MVGLTVLWSVLLLAAVVLAHLGGDADSLGYDRPGLPPSDALAGIDDACGGVVLAVAVLVVAAQLAVAALRWYLDPSARVVRRDAASEEPRPARQDF